MEDFEEIHMKQEFTDEVVNDIEKLSTFNEIDHVLYDLDKEENILYPDNVLPISMPSLQPDEINEENDQVQIFDLDGNEVNTTCPLDQKQGRKSLKNLLNVLNRILFHGIRRGD